MVQLILMLTIVPGLFGFFIKKAIHNTDPGFCMYFYCLGFLVMVAEFALVCYPAIYLNTPFHTVCYVVYGIYAVQVVFIAFWIFIKKQISVKLLNKEWILSYLKSPAFWIMFFLCGFQLVRLLVAAPAEIRDSNSYNALVNDILQRDLLFRTMNGTGSPVGSVLDLPLRFSFSPWYPFLSMLARFSKLHSLVICNTVFPPYILWLHYIIIYSLGYYLFKRNNNEAFLFTALCAFLYEITLYCHTATMIKLVWPVWGKGILSMLVIPAILVLFMLFVDEESHFHSSWILVLLLFIVIAGVSMSTMATLVLPMEICILGGIWAFRKHSVRMIVFSIVSCIPAGVYAVIYYYCSTLLALR